MLESLIPNLLYDFNLASNAVSIVEGPDHQPLTFGLGCSIGGITYSNGISTEPSSSTAPFIAWDHSIKLGFRRKPM